MDSNKDIYYKECEACQGQGRKSRKPKKKLRVLYQKQLEEHHKNPQSFPEPKRPKRILIPCLNCNGKGIVQSATPPILKKYPKVAIIGGGIGGIALGVACLHRGIPFTIYERDASFNERSQGYGLTLQQASRAIEGLGLVTLKNGIVSNKHMVFKTDGTKIGEWGMRKWIDTNSNTTNKRTNIHIARQELRKELLEQLSSKNCIQWSHQLLEINKNKNHDLTFDVDGKQVFADADIIVGADGIRSTVRKSIIQEKDNPLRYLNCIVILGICSLETLNEVNNELLDGKTVFQTANGNERIYIMPFDKESVMWQLSFPLSENEALTLSKKGAKSLKKEAISRTDWHNPIPQIIQATPEQNVSGYPVYDRDLISEKAFLNADKTTLIGDAAHPMSPFKGQGANQALLDAIALARKITKLCGEGSQWCEKGIRNSVLLDFEKEMISRSASKVKGSANAALYLHSDVVLKESDTPRGSNYNLKERP